MLESVVAWLRSLTPGEAAAFLSVVVAVATLAVLRGQKRLQSASERRDNARLVFEIAQRWTSLRPSWNMAQLLARGPDSTYVDATAEERNNFAQRQAALEHAKTENEEGLTELMLQMQRATTEARERLLLGLGYRPVDVDDEAFLEILKREEPGSTAMQRFEADMTKFWEEVDWARGPHDEQADLTPWNLAAREILRFFAEVCGLILRGTIRPADAYEAFGAEVARNGGAIRDLLDDKVQSWLLVQPGLKLRVLILIDLMWAEGAKLGELETQPTPEQAAAHKKRTGTGKRNRQRAYRLTKRISGRRMARRIAKHLRNAEHPAGPMPWDRYFSSLRSAPGDNP